jgi:hypothetical protein
MKDENKCHIKTVVKHMYQMGQNQSNWMLRYNILR